ncbi:MAG: transcriptional repressor [bacterium]
MKGFELLCKEQGTPCTIQRRVILEAMLDHNDHPTADQVYQDLQERRLGISRATVHRTLETLARLGAITKACHPGKATRYDPRTEIHHHLICLRCDKIIDINDQHFDSLKIPDTSAFHFEVADFRVQLRGICQECRDK